MKHLEDTEHNHHVYFGCVMPQHVQYNTYPSTVRSHKADFNTGLEEGGILIWTPDATSRWCVTFQT